MPILLNKPLAPCLKTLNGYLEHINQSGWYTNFGPLHQKLTDRLEEYLGVENLLLVANGTLALHVAYRVLEIKSAICTPFSFAATASSLAWEKVPFTFVDINSDSLNLSPTLVAEKLKNTEEIDAIVATHVYGNPCDIEAFGILQQKHNVKIIYDGAHAFNVRYRKESLLNYGDVSILSFHATKVFHTIEGGAIVFKDKEAYERAKRIINFSIDANGMASGIGINAKLNEYQCAVGLTLLETMNEVLDHRVELFNLYRRFLKGHVELPVWNESASINGAYFPIILKTEEDKRQLKSALQNSDIQSREYFSPSLNIIFSPQQHCPVSESISSRVLCLPLHYYMTAHEVMKIIETIKEIER
ncbi:DegT/DnrJ/EryC1/StrS family aminotransferase [bacterium]|nr:DegT/DnrJ/EryC1/StrS family aminotransferase [bacterium]